MDETASSSLIVEGGKSSAIEAVGTPDEVADHMASAMEVFYHQSEPSVAEAAARRLTPQPEGARRSHLHLSEARFGNVPRVYIETLDDRSVHLPLQRKMHELTPCHAVYALESDHAPQLSHPDALTALFLEAAVRNARTL